MDPKAFETAPGAPTPAAESPAYAPPAIAWEEPFEPMAATSGFLVGCGAYPAGGGECDSQPAA